MHIVKCFVCGKSFDRDKEPAVQVTKRRYAHKACAENNGAQTIQQEKVKAEFFQYLEKLFGKGYDYVVNSKLAESYITDYGFTYSGMQKALYYFYEVLHNDISQAEGRIGIIPYTYEQAYRYFYDIWEKQQINKEKNVADYIPKKIIVSIPEPQRQVKRPKVFTFLDEEKENDI